MKNTTTALAAAIPLCLAMSAQAGITFVSDVGDNSALTSQYAALMGVNAGSVQVNQVAGLSANSMNFGTAPSALNPIANGGFDVAVTAASGNFVLDLLGDSGLGNNWFNAGQTPAPSDDTIVLAFGNKESATNANQVNLAFNPGVTAFGFNYEDVGDFGGVLTINWTNGTQTMLDTGLFTADGFISIVSDDANITIDSIKLSSNNANDGFAFYGFQTVQVVPLPSPVLAGLGLLGGLGIARRIRKSQ
ncbi:MAG: hypothetical protein WD114_06720 [Phycisphaerales bacterium]